MLLSEFAVAVKGKNERNGLDLLLKKQLLPLIKIIEIAHTEDVQLVFFFLIY